MLIATLFLAAEPRPSAEEKTKAVNLLKESRDEFLKQVEGLTAEQWRFKPAPDRWSIAEVSEHIMRTELGLFGFVKKALADPVNPEWEKKTEGKTAFIEKVMPTPVQRAQAPVEVRPEGKMTREEVLEGFKKGRGQVLELMETTEAPLHAHTADHPFPVFGTLSAYQWICYIPWHTQRHLKQIAGVKADPNFPK